jgi:hypothetical protein
MTLDGKMLCFTSAATIRQLLVVILIWVTKTLKYRLLLIFFTVFLCLKGWKRNAGERRKGDKDAKRIKERKKLGGGEDTKEIIPR